VPAFENVATTFLAAFVPFAENRTAAGGVPVVAHVYLSAASPPGSEPSTDNVVVVPVTIAGLAVAGVATLGPTTGAARRMTVIE